MDELLTPGMLSELSRARAEALRAEARSVPRPGRTRRRTGAREALGARLVIAGRRLMRQRKVVA